MAVGTDERTDAETEVARVGLIAAAALVHPVSIERALGSFG